VRGQGTAAGVHHTAAVKPLGAELKVQQKAAFIAVRVLKLHVLCLPMWSTSLMRARAIALNARVTKLVREGKGQQQRVVITALQCKVGSAFG
jgi:hypothetical protein